jgi:exonuclease VII large subunit
VNLNSESEILTALSDLDQKGVDVIAISRGGGENLDIFNKPMLADKCISLKALFITAIGHKDDVTLLQKIADKAFITPSEFGQFLNDTYNQTNEELQHSKARLIESISSQLKANYQKQIDNLNEQLLAVEGLKKQSILDIQKVNNENIIALNKQMKLAEKNLNDQILGVQKLQDQKVLMLNQQVESMSKDVKSKENLLLSYKNQITTLESQSSVNWGAILVAIVIGVIIGFAIHGG